MVQEMTSSTTTLSLLLPQLKLPLTINLPLILIQLTIQKCSPLHGLDLDVKLNALNILMIMYYNNVQFSFDYIYTEHVYVFMLCLMHKMTVYDGKLYYSVYM